MIKETIILVTGVGDYWGRRLALYLLDQPGLRVIGLDRQPPTEKVPGLDFVQADVRNPLLVELLRDEHIDVCYHLKFIPGDNGDELASEVNVQGTMNVVGACAEAQVNQIVLRSSTMVYGAHADNAAFLTESSPLRGGRQMTSIRDLVEIESFVATFRRQEAQIKLTILRFANIVGPTVNSPMTQLLTLPAPPVLLGFDPLLQFVHEDDVVGALVLSTNQGADGVYNVAAADPIPLSRALRLVGRRALPIFHPLAYRAAEWVSGPNTGSASWTPLPWDYLRYRWTGDLKRMQEVLTFAPRYSAAEALQEVAHHHRTRADRDGAGNLAQDEEQLRNTLRHRRSMKETRKDESDADAGEQT
ncbi:MAG: NAD-dependent epimerase/dehydratase family protein [Candidatus Promineifilaceae bacterium]|nr:NAD-dependent epimerase/dehydratase family protein [Candidatus Promineifilaceae bacterium]